MRHNFLKIEVVKGRYSYIFIYKEGILLPVAAPSEERETEEHLTVKIRVFRDFGENPVVNNGLQLPIEKSIAMAAIFTLLCPRVKLLMHG